MIASLRGLLSEVSADHVVVDVNGVGYRVFASQNTMRSLPAVGREVSIRVWTQLRDDALLLYGFSSMAEKEAFLALTSVTGVGPRLGMAVLSVFNPAELARAVAAKDLQSLTRVPGVGKKTAERLLLELRDKLDVETVAVQGNPVDYGAAAGGPLLDAIEALVTLGYGRTEAEQAIAAVARDVAAGEEAAIEPAGWVRKALGRLVTPA